MDNTIHIIAGATASGKSARALEYAKTHHGVIINADATQLYADLRILSARPDEAEMAQAPHRLYGILKATEIASVGGWQRMAVKEIHAAWSQQKQPIICGGTGMYIKALREGLSPIPSIEPKYRQQATEALEANGHAALYAQLQQIDPVFTQRIEVENSQRLIRAYEVWLATGRSLSEWQAEPKNPPFQASQFTLEVIDLPREEIYARCDARFHQMIEQGAIEEVKALLAKNLSPALPLMKAVGVPEIRAYLAGETSLEEAIKQAQKHTRHYVKRQLTWLRNQVGKEVSN